MYDYTTPDMYADFGEDIFAGAMGGTILGVFVIVYLLVIFFALIFSVASYVLHSMGLYTIAERRGLRHKWLAWLPVGNVWLLGSVSDQYQYVAKGKVTNRRKIMLALSIAGIAVYIGWLIGIIGSAIAGYVGAAVLGMALGWLLFVGVMITLSVFQFIAYYDLYRSCQPSNAVLYLVLSIIFSVTVPFFVFFIRNKELGMPPRKQVPIKAEETAEMPAEESVEAPADPPAEENAKLIVKETEEEPTQETTEE